MAAMSGVIRSFTNAVTTAPKAPPMTTATARSITLPRSMNCLKPLSITASCAGLSICWAHGQNRYLSEADVHHVPAGLQRPQRGWRRLRRCQLLHGPDPEDQAERTVAKNGVDGSGPAPHQGTDLQNVESCRTRSRRRRDSRLDGQASGLDSASDRGKGEPRDSRAACRAVERDSLAHGRPPRSAIRRIAGSLTSSRPWNRWPQDSGETSRYSCVDSSSTYLRRFRRDARAFGSAPRSRSSRANAASC